ncbi:hypothetical protein [Streptomyces sp. NPDC101115]|uniref:zinc finger domain-containing protein n=1 Tax=Streptomyces sp. NPDC101115 TaxID=3366106 RepID=UPI0038166FCB
MKKSEAARLLAHAAAFDNRTVGEVDATAWAAALYDVPLDDDANAAVARYYGTPPEREGDRKWLQPHHVRSGRLAIRKERLGTTLPGYMPPPELETGAQFVARRRQQIDDVASGRAPARPVPLDGPMSRQMRDGLAERGWGGLDDDRGLAAVGRKVTREPEDQTAALIRTVRRPGPLGIECPQCGAAMGHPCKSRLGRTHGTRTLVAAGETPSTETPEEFAARRERYLAHLDEQAQREQAEAAS